MQIIKQHVIAMSSDEQVKNVTKVIEQSARTCYLSNNKITADSADDFVRKLIKNKHEAMLEHASLQFKFVTDRATANALVRHRHCAFAQESTHFIDYGKKEELTFIEQEGIKHKDLYLSSLRTIELLYMSINVDEDRRVRRSLLPLALKTELIITTSIREWRSILKIRTGNGVHPQMKALMSDLLVWFKQNLPILVEDM